VYTYKAFLGRAAEATNLLAELCLSIVAAAQSNHLNEQTRKYMKTATACEHVLLV